MKRQDERGRAFAGSQLQLQIYVNRHPDQLAAAIVTALHPKPPLNTTIVWVSPLESERFIEYCDRDFLRVLGLSRFAEQLSNFWPKGGPSWDGLAICRHEDKDVGYILVEAKSYVDEMQSGCAAKAAASLAKIETALTQTKLWLGVAKENDWKRDLYQSANRLAHLYFFREVIKQEAWLVNLCFTSDPYRPTSIEEWTAGLAASKAQVGLSTSVPWVSDILLPAQDRDELFHSTHDKKPGN
jgi:hypothetical protein